MQINIEHVLEGGLAFVLVEATAYFTGNVPAVLSQLPLAMGVAYVGMRNGISLTQIEGYANTLLASVQGTNSKTDSSNPAPTDANPTGSAATNPPQPKPFTKQYSFILTAIPTKTGIGQNLTLSVKGGTPNSSWTCYEVENGSTLTQPHPLDANGEGQIVFNPVSAPSAIGATLQAQGVLNIYAQDITGLRSNTVTLTQA